MARLLRIEFPRAIYDVTSRGPYAAARVKEFVNGNGAVAMNDVAVQDELVIQ